MNEQQPRRTATNDHEIIEMLAHGLSYQSTAERLGTSKSVVARRMRNPKFRASVNARRGVRIEHLVTALKSGVDESIAYLREVVTDENAGRGDRIKAATALLNATARVPTADLVRSPEDARQMLLEKLIEVRDQRQREQLAEVGAGLTEGRS